MLYKRNMAILQILTEDNASDNEFLRKVSKPVADFNARLGEILSDMAETMDYADGVGIAAPQVGILWRAVIIRSLKYGIIEMVNPVITKASNEKADEEGCLSVIGVRGKVLRPHKVSVKFQDRAGKWNELDLTGMDAVCACHEIDHLDGILFIDKLV
jgi:peptide deformylase